MKDHVRERCILFTAACGIVLWTARLGMALVVSEIMYHPIEEGGTSQGDQSLEFIELYNDRAVFEDLSGYTFSEDIEYTFPPYVKIQSNQ